MSKRDVRADYIAEYRAEYDRAVAAGRTKHAGKVAEILAGYGVKVKAPKTSEPDTPKDPASDKPKETTSGDAPPETTADPKPKRGKK